MMSAKETGQSAPERGSSTELFPRPSKDVRRPLLASVAEAYRRHGKPRLRHLEELRRLCFWEGRISRDEYYLNGLHRAAQLTSDAAKRYIGKRALLHLDAQLNHWNSTSAKIVNDKILSEWAFRVLEIPTTRTLAAFGAPHGLLPLRPLCSDEEIKAFLEGEGRRPLFGKPLAGSASVGALNIAQACGIDGMTTLADGRRLPVGDLSEAIVEAFPSGYIFQERVAQHPRITALSGDSVSTVRLVIVRAENGPEIAYAVWKLASPESQADNAWRAGVAVCLIDPETGHLLRAARQTPDGPEPVLVHGPERTPLEGFALPFWPETRALALKAADALEGLALTGWDVAIGPEGPLVVEGNRGPAPQIYQIAAGEGLMTPRFEALLASARRRMGSPRPPALPPQGLARLRRGLARRAGKMLRLDIASLLR